MKAREARNLSNKFLVTAHDYEAGAMTLDAYHDKIVNQLRAGKSILVERGKIKEDTMAQLKLEGYKVQCRWDKKSGLYWTKVSWEEAVPEKKITIWLGVALGIILLACVGLLLSKIL